MKNIGIPLSSTAILMLGMLGCFDTARAQNALSASPQQITFNTQNGVTTTPQNILLTSSSPVSVGVSATSANNWLTVSPTSGITPLSLTISVGSNAPTSGTAAGFINVTSSAGSLSIPVTLNANSLGTSSLSASPNAVSFTFAPGSTTLATQTVNVSSSNSSVTAFTATGITNSGANWLTVNPLSGAVPGSFQVSVNPAALGAAGTFNAAVAINAPGTTGIVLPILVTQQGTASLNVTPSQFSFGYQTGTTLPTAQSLTITSSTGSSVSFTATTSTVTCGGNWLVLSQMFGATPSTFTVSVNPLGVTPGQTCTGSISISSPGLTPVVIPVSLLVSNSPLLQAPTTGPTFNYQTGGTVPAAQNVQITSTTSGVSFTAAAATINNGPAFLQVSPASGTTPQALTLSLIPAVLATLGPGTYSENVTVSSSAAGNVSQTFTVTLMVSSNAVLNSNATGLNFNFEIGQTTPASQTLTISSTGAPLNYQVSTTTTNCNGFLTATPANGSTFGNGNQVVVSVNTSGITPQVCSGNVVLTVPGTSTSLTIPVSLNVSTSPLLNVGLPAINVTALAGSTTAIPQTISVTSTDNSSQNFTATATTSPAGLTWLSVTPNSGVTPTNLQVTINPTGLGIGTYSGTISIQGTGSVPAQTVPVTLTIASASVTATPTSLSFTQSIGGTAPGSQTVQIANVPAGTTVGAVATLLNGSGWLTTSVNGSTVTVTANGSQLAAGTYSGVVTVIVPGAQNSPVNVPVTLTIGAAPALAVSPSTINMTYQLGSQGTLQVYPVQITSTGSNVPVAAAFTPLTGGNFATLSLTSSTTPSTLNLSVNPSVAQTLAPGMYTGTVAVSSSSIPGGNQTVTVNLTVTAGPTPVITSITNAGSLQPGAIAPGEIITIFGTNIGSGPASGTTFQPTSAGTVPTTLGGVTVTFNNVAAPLIFVAPNQINAIVPYELSGQAIANVVATINGATSASFQAQVVPTSPAIFSLSFTGSGQGAILNQNNSVNSVNNPAAKGSVIQIFGTGEGQLVPGVQTACFTGLTLPLPKPVATPITVTIGGQPATPITYAGEAPGEVCGVIQIDATVPTNIGSGPQPVVLTIGTNTNSQQSITVAVQ